MTKIDILKENIDSNATEDPLVRLRMKTANKGLKFSLKKVNMKTIKKNLKKMKKKKSCGIDVLSQEHLVMGANTLTPTLTWMINQSIETEVVPEH